MCNKMSDVRLSNASPTLERVDARQADPFRPSVRRNLFGTPDPKEIKKCAEETMRDDVRSFMQKYNFDPVEEQPLPGDFRWVKDDSPPEFYLRAAHGSQREVQRANGRDGAGRRSAAEEQRSGSRKRRSQDSGSCSNDCPNKSLHTDGDDEDDRSDGAGSQAVRAAERRPSRPENSAEVR